MNCLKRIYIKYEKDGIWRIISILLKKLGIKTTYSSFMHKKKFNLYRKISKITKHKVVNGYYKSLILSKNYNWNKDDVDLSPKLLGCYEEQVQEKIIELKKKNNLKYLVVFGASEGFHALGLMKNKFFNKAYIFEKDNRTRNLLIKNSLINKIKNINIFSEANFYCIANFLKENATKTLFLIDIEGEEFNILNKKNLPYYKNSYLIIENHQDFIENSKLKNIFFKLINKNFNVNYLENGSRNPHKFKILDFLNDDEKYLIMSENRPCTMNWLILSPKI
jgi:hypothetical protein